MLVKKLEWSSKYVLTNLLDQLKLLGILSTVGLVKTTSALIKLRNIARDMLTPIHIILCIRKRRSHLFSEADSFHFQLNSAPADIPDMYSKPGTACNEYTGYCDVFQKCREVSWKKKIVVLLLGGGGKRGEEGCARGCQNELRAWRGGLAARVRKWIWSSSESCGAHF